MNRHDFINRLIELPQLIEQAEHAVLALEERRIQRTETLTRAEDLLLIEGVEGKNAEVRAALLREQTSTERWEVNDAERQVTEAKITLRRLITDLSALKAVARLVGGAE